MSQQESLTEMFKKMSDMIEGLVEENEKLKEENDVLKEQVENYPQSAEGYEDDDEEAECKCEKCNIDITYDDCIHYQEFIYYCKKCGVDDDGNTLDDICIECYDRNCRCE
jgi:regulator of replication initiation timing